MCGVSQILKTMVYQENYGVSQIPYTGGYLQAGRRQKSPPVTVIWPAVLECVHIYIYCLKVNIAGYFLDFAACF